MSSLISSFFSKAGTQKTSSKRKAKESPKSSPRSKAAKKAPQKTPKSSRRASKRGELVTPEQTTRVGRAAARAALASKDSSEDEPVTELADIATLEAETTSTPTKRKSSTKPKATKATKAARSTRTTRTTRSARSQPASEEKDTTDEQDTPTTASPAKPKTQTVTTDAVTTDAAEHKEDQATTNTPSPLGTDAEIKATTPTTIPTSTPKPSKPAPPRFTETSKYKKLDHLLTQTSLYSKFLSDRIPDVATDAKDKKAKGKVKAKKVEDKYKVCTLLPKSYTLRDYQVQGVNWLISLYENGLNGILADEMGLGKTIQAIMMISHLRSKGVKAPFLIAAPLSTLHNWEREFKKFAPTTPCLLYHGSKDERGEMRAALPSSVEDPEFPVIITSYELCIKDKAFLGTMEWKFLVVDEGHRLKNLECILIKTLKDFNSQNRLLLTGTPLQNNLRELWSLLNFLLPTIFDSLQRFESWFDFDATDINDEQMQQSLIAREREHHIISKLHEILRPFVLRRLKNDVLKGLLPSKTEYIIYTPLTRIQRFYYQAILEGRANELFEGTQSAGLKNTLMQLRKACNHPFLLREPEGENGDLITDERIVEMCGKLKLVDRLLEKLLPKGHRVLIFSQMTRVLDILQDYLDYRGISHCRIDGSVQAKDRQERISKFQTSEGSKVFLLSTRAGGLGINLTCADTVIIYDSDWNPTQDDQAQDRCHRIGQKKKVLVFRLITPGSAEVAMLARATGKRKLEQMVIAKGNLKGIAKGPRRLVNKDDGLADAHNSSSKEEILQELMDLFNIQTKEEGEEDKATIANKENRRDTTTTTTTRGKKAVKSPAKSPKKSGKAASDTVEPYIEGVLNDDTLNALLDRSDNKKGKHNEGCLKEGFQLVKSNSSFRDLF